MERDFEKMRRRLLADTDMFGAKAESWLDVRAMERERKAIEQRHEGVDVSLDGKTLEHYVRLFRASGNFESQQHLRYVCFGLARDVGGWSVLGSAHHLMTVLDRVSAEDRPHRRRGCFQGLLASYFGDRPEEPRDPRTAGWLELRRWLNSNLESLIRSLVRLPDWLWALADHRNLLEGSPCTRYGPSLLRGDSSEFTQLLARIAVPSASWVRDEAVLAQVIAVTTMKDSTFLAALSAILSLLREERQFPMSKTLQRACVAGLVSRYAAGNSLPEHDELRDIAVSVIGNPWLMRTEWDAYVVDASGKPDERARSMVDGWLKRRLISDFFELLSADGSSDSRRLTYWLRFEPLISDMWFVLGDSSGDGSGSALLDFRKRARGRLLRLSSASAKNNAFIMRVGKYVMVEFGEKGNACYVYPFSDLPRAVTVALNSGGGRVELHDLKSKDSADERMVHMDSPSRVLSWEQKFDRTLRELLAHAIPGRAACVPELEKIVVDKSLPSEDLRPRGGNLWVYTGMADRTVNTKLAALGFTYKMDKGWWLSGRD